MGRVLYEDTLKNNMVINMSPSDDKPYKEPNSVHIGDDWDTMMEDFIDDFDDYQDVNFPNMDDDY